MVVNATRGTSIQNVQHEDNEVRRVEGEEMLPRPIHGICIIRVKTYDEGCDGGESGEGAKIRTKENTDEKVRTTSRCPGNRVG